MVYVKMVNSPYQDPITRLIGSCPYACFRQMSKFDYQASVSNCKVAKLCTKEFPRQ